MLRPIKIWVVSLPVILAVALAMRLAFAADFIHKNPSHALGVIPFLFEPGNIARSLATAHGFASPFRVETGPTAWMAPVYPMLLAGVFRVFGIYTYQAFLAAVALNIAFSTVTCVPIFFAGKRIGGLGFAAFAAWLWALFPNAIVLPFESLWDACLAALLAATILWATIAIVDGRRMRNWIAYGLLWGLELMTYPTLAALLPFLFGWLAYRSLFVKKNRACDLRRRFVLRALDNPQLHPLSRFHSVSLDPRSAVVAGNARSSVAQRSASHQRFRRTREIRPAGRDPVYGGKEARGNSLHRRAPRHRSTSDGAAICRLLDGRIATSMVGPTSNSLVPISLGVAVEHRDRCWRFVRHGWLYSAHVTRI